MKQLNYIFKVPNDTYGRQFIEDLRHYLNHESYTIKLRGRNKFRRLLGCSRKNDVPFVDAEYFSVYLKAKIRGTEPITVGIDDLGKPKRTSFVKRFGRWVKK